MEEVHVPILGSTQGGAREGAGRKRKNVIDIRATLAQESNGGRDYLDALHEIAVESADATPAQRLKALELLFGYMWGRPSTQVPDEPLRLDVTHRLSYTDEELETMIAAASPESDENS